MPEQVDVQVLGHVSDDLLPSVGSALHGAGICKPCAWFWKADGCQNGRECLHCHLCSKGAVKALKRSRRRLAPALPQNQQVVMPQVLPFRPPPGLEAPQPLHPAKFYTDQFLKVPPLIGKSSKDADIPEDASTDLTDDEQSSYQESDSWGSVEEEVSAGSTLHDSGMCKPCSFFWTAQGCHLGKDCSHCHRCPQGEVKRRKKLMQQMKKSTKAAQALASCGTARQQELRQQMLHMQMQLHVQQQHFRMQMMARHAMMGAWTALA
eukprot:TRINITY_DN5374_c0_g1_i11.p1 TRINITY_DN5374_c0_g1~~TRINITY_DN5374_c0_g1_i11.p1  ORF type:complete len:264 (+),score=62.26 TRINITY_DN5374_c0_g1_i11:779-1570(+)